MEPGKGVTVFRSADADRGTQAGLIADRLRAAGIEADVADPGEVVGTCEVQVDPADRARAEEIVAALPGHLEGDTSSALDMIPVYSTGLEADAYAVKGILDSAGLNAVVVGASLIPSLPFEVQVPRAEADAAREAIDAAQAAGPAAAEAAEAETESASSSGA